MSRLPPAPRLTADALNAANASSRPDLVRHASHDSHSSGDSHSSHSSHQERQRAQHLGEAPGGPPSVAKPIASAVGVLLILLIGQAVGLWLFTGGFLLTRTTLEGVSECSRPAQHTYSAPQIQFQDPVSISEYDLVNWERAVLEQSECRLPAKYSRTLLWIVDALRYDFIAQAPLASNNSDWQPNDHYHNVLDLPARLNAAGQGFSFLSHSVADAPTTTLQRLKGLTTGSLPTFIDAGSNFGGSAILEDNWLQQFRKDTLDHNPQDRTAKMGLAGDDTWLTVFPTVFDERWRFPFDSFNVEDLDTVDRGVEKVLKTFLDGQDPSRADWRMLVAHALGVDHVGHRLGASHPRMRSKLTEMNDFLKYTVDKLPEDALLLFIGDHGMDEKGDHGGDGELETGAALWMYSKRRRSGGIDRDVIDLILSKSSEFDAPYINFSPLPSPPFAHKAHRSVSQIDIVPTLSLLLGLPVPFNNLGSVIPEAFESQELLLRALRINSIQVHRYLGLYAKAAKDFRPYQSEIEAAWKAALRADARLASRRVRGASRPELEIVAAQAYMHYNRLVLVRAKQTWASFDMAKMVSGLTLLLVNTLLILRLKSASGRDSVESLFSSLCKQGMISVAAGGTFGLVHHLASIYAPFLTLFHSFGLVESVSLGATLAQQACLLVSKYHADSQVSEPGWSSIGLLLPIVHAFAFSSNSFIINEHKFVLALTVAVLLIRGIQGFLSSPTLRLRIRAPLLAALSALVVRLASLSHVCREEEGPKCATTFYIDSTSSLSSPLTIAAAYISALVVPTLLKRALHASRSDAGIAPLFFTWILQPALLAGAGYWFVDWLSTAEMMALTPTSQAAFETAKIFLARFDYAVVCIIAMSLWIFSPLCLEMSREPIPEAEKQQQQPVQAGTDTPNDSPPTTRITVLGFANSFGSSYLLLVAIVFTLQFLIAQPMGQVALSLVLVALVATAELGDHERDAVLLQGSLNGSAPQRPPSLPISMTETSTLALLGFVAFFATGHQATFASIQWRTAFVGLKTVQYPFSPLLVILNSFGPVALLPAMVVPLYVLWNLAPLPRRAPKASGPDKAGGNGAEPPPEDNRMPTVMHILQASLSFLFYHTLLTLSTAVFAAHFRRHLMLFKIWTPRFMLGAASLQLVYIGLILGLVASGTVMSKVSVTFGSSF